MTTMQKTGTNASIGFLGLLMNAASWAIENYNAVIGTVAGTAGAILAVISAINAVNIMRDRRRRLRLEAEMKIERDRLRKIDP